MQDDDDQAALRLLSTAAVVSDICESNGFYYAAGWAIRKELQKINCSSCSNCLQNLTPKCRILNVFWT